MSRLTLHLLGPPRIERDGAPVVVDTRKAINAIAYVAVTRQPHSRDTLAALLWPEYDHVRAYANRDIPPKVSLTPRLAMRGAGRRSTCCTSRRTVP